MKIPQNNEHTKHAPIKNETGTQNSFILYCNTSYAIVQLFSEPEATETAGKPGKERCAALRLAVAGLFMRKQMQHCCKIVVKCCISRIDMAEKVQYNKDGRAACTDGKQYKGKDEAVRRYFRAVWLLCGLRYAVICEDKRACTADAGRARAWFHNILMMSGKGKLQGKCNKVVKFLGIILTLPNWYIIINTTIV